MDKCLFRLLYGRGVPIGHIGTGVANMTIQCQYDIEAHLEHIITFLIHLGFTFNVSIICWIICVSETENWRVGNSNNRAGPIDK